MTRSARSSTLTATRASRAAQNQKPPPMNASPRRGGASSSSNSSSTSSSKPVAKNSPRSLKKKEGVKENGREDSDEADESKTRVRPKRKSDGNGGSSKTKKSRIDEGTKNGLGISNGAQESSEDEDDQASGSTSRRRRDQETSRSSRRSGAQKEDKHEDISEEEEDEEMKEEEEEPARRTRSKKKSLDPKTEAAEEDEEGEEEEEEEPGESDSEVILTGVKRGSKKKAMDTMLAINAHEDEESDIEEILDSEDEDESGDEGSDEEESEEEVGRASRGKTRAKLVSNNRGDAIGEMREEFEKMVRQKDLEIQRLKNELSFKEHQLEDLNELSTKNMELEARISAMLSSQEGYNAEVEAIAKRKKKEAEAEKVKKEEEQKPKAKKSVIAEKKDDSDIEEISGDADQSQEEGEDAVEVISDGETDDKPTRPQRRRRSRRGKADEEESQKIEALFVSDDEDDELKKEKKKKKDNKKANKKEVDDDIEVIEVQDDDEDDKDKGRHNIRRLMTDKKLASETKAAALEEKERLQRVAKLKEKHQIESHIDSKTKQPVYTKMVLAFKKDQKTPLIEVNTKLLKKLKPHQVEGVEFMWDSVIETVDAAKKKEPGSGCILAHCMGLGKTLSVITFVHTLLSNKQLKLKTCLVVCPLNTVLNWEHEWQKWLDKKDRLPTYEMASAKDNHQRADLLTKWQKEGGIMIMGYQIFRILATSTTKSKKKKKIFDESLISSGADIIICDEGHVLKNDASAVSKCMNKIRSKRRIILTGTPLQNNLIEYHCMVSFVKPNLMGSRKEFCNRFVNPITNGQHADSTGYDVKLMKRRAHVLHKMLSGCVQRRDYSALTKFLPPKYEYIISVRLSPLQIKLYEMYLEKFVGSAANPMARGTSLFSDYQALMRIWTHPWVLKMDEIRQEKKMTYTEDDDDELGSFLASDTSEEEEEEDSKSSSKSEEEEGKAGDDDSKEESDIEIIERPRRTRRSVNKEKEEAKENSKTNGRKGKQTKEEKNGSGEEVVEEGTVRRAKLVAGEVIKHWQTTSRRRGVDEEGPEKKVDTPWWAEFVNEDDHKKMLELSGKLVILFDILRMAEGLGDKVLVFSQSLLTLDLIEDFLGYKNEEAEKLREGKKGKSASSIPLWVKDEDYCRMDGSTSAQNRTKFTTNFNSQKNKRMRLFLISTKAGGLGINLDSANRVVIFDASWNPSHDIQSIFRAYRFGQEKDVFIYRLLAQGTMEEKIYERQVTKETLSQRVIDEHQMDRHFTASDLQELYIFQPDRLDDPERKERPTPAVPKDIILAELLSERKEWLVGYHEHDSLLEKRPDEDLSEEERKTAWDEYEKEKQGFMHHYRPPTAPVTMYNYNYRPPVVNPNLAFNPRPYVPPAANQPQPYMGLLASPPGFTSEQAKLNFQLSQLPRVVQEILKYNPNITPSELQTRLRAFMGMHTKYSNVPGFAMPGSLQSGAMAAANASAADSTSTQPSTSSTSSSSSSAPSSTPSMSSQPRGGLPSSWPSSASAATPSQISQLITNSIVNATTDAMPSRLPLPGRVPANVPR